MISGNARYLSVTLNRCSALHISGIAFSSSLDRSRETNKWRHVSLGEKTSFQCKLQIVRTTRRISCFFARWGHIFRTTVGHIFARWHIFLRQTPFLCGTDIYALRNGPVDLAYQQRQCAVSLSKTFLKKSLNFGWEEVATIKRNWDCWSMRPCMPAQRHRVGSHAPR